MTLRMGTDSRIRSSHHLALCSSAAVSIAMTRILSMRAVEGSLPVSFAVAIFCCLNVPSILANCIHFLAEVF